MTTVTSKPYDLVVIGGGTAGLVGAKTAASLGAKVLLVEHERPGGDCLWTGCVPSKSLLAMAAKNASGTPVSFTAAMDHVRAAIATIEPEDSFASLRQARVDVRTGTARFLDPQCIVVDDEIVPFRQALVATGARPAAPAIPGLLEIDYRTSESIWNLSALPARMLVLGGGAIACELGQAFARLGSSVSLVARGDRLLRREDAAAAALVEAAMSADGVRIVTNRSVVRLTSGEVPGSGVAHLNDDTELEFDALLVAMGREPRTANIGLAEVGVDLDDRGFVQVDDHLRTSNPVVWAAGDVTARSAFTHTAGVHASLAATNAILGLRRSISTVVPRVTFTSPELAAVGASSDAASLEPGDRVLHIDHDHLDRAITAGQRVGFTRLVVSRKGKIVGATIVGPRAGESLGEVTLAIAQGLRPRDIASVTHPYPTYNDAIWNAAVADVRASLTSPPASLAISIARRLRSRWLRRRYDR